ncbi:hypothetical protein K432DRAFT_386774 [Lepidopterella palustris CBS 459.81]|uniref:Uncharacterized protein n=1 Tax=Lepidopterella palustris CBS 459.81 TaxID=1314670 RepID=A0A8E2DZ91_9PEZI|nr:hypothetical protein K432DRAFT_386774 [Lepidopterella palustris CBS 459.81]
MAACRALHVLPLARAMSYSDLRPKEIILLTSILSSHPLPHIPPFCVESIAYVERTRKRIADLRPHLQSKLAHTLAGAWRIAPDPGTRARTGELCPELHGRLSQKLVQSIFEWIKDEIEREASELLYPLLYHKALTSAQEQAMRVLEPVVEMWKPGFDPQQESVLGRPPVRMTIGTHQKEFSLWQKQADGCKACMIARIGGDKDVCIALLANMVARMKVKRIKDGKSGRVMWLKAWLNGHDESGEFVGRAWDLGMEIKRVRRTIRRQIREGGILDPWVTAAGRLRDQGERSHAVDLPETWNPTPGPVSSISSPKPRSPGTAQNYRKTIGMHPDEIKDEDENEWDLSSLQTPRYDSHNPSPRPSTPPPLGHVGSARDDPTQALPHSQPAANTQTRPNSVAASSAYSRMTNGNLYEPSLYAATSTTDLGSISEAPPPLPNIFRPGELENVQEDREYFGAATPAPAPALAASNTSGKAKWKPTSTPQSRYQAHSQTYAETTAQSRYKAYSQTPNATPFPLSATPQNIDTNISTNVRPNIPPPLRTAPTAQRHFNPDNPFTSYEEACRRQRGAEKAAREGKDEYSSTSASTSTNGRHCTRNEPSSPVSPVQGYAGSSSGRFYAGSGNWYGRGAESGTSKYETARYQNSRYDIPRKSLHRRELSRNEDAPLTNRIVREWGSRESMTSVQTRWSDFYQDGRPF